MPGDPASSTQSWHKHQRIMEIRPFPSWSSSGNALIPCCQTMFLRHFAIPKRNEKVKPKRLKGCIFLKDLESKQVSGPLCCHSPYLIQTSLLSTLPQAVKASHLGRSRTACHSFEESRSTRQSWHDGRPIPGKHRTRCQWCSSGWRPVAR